MVSLATVSLLQPVTTQLVTSESHADIEELKLIRLASRVKVGLRATVDGSEIRRENHLFPTLRIIPGRTQVVIGSPPFVAAMKFGHLEGEQPYLGDLLTVDITHLLTGMILHKYSHFTNSKPPNSLTFRPFKWLHI